MGVFRFNSSKKGNGTRKESSNEKKVPSMRSSTARNPSFGKEEELVVKTQEDQVLPVDVDPQPQHNPKNVQPLMLVCGSDDGTSFLKGPLSKPPYSLQLTDDIDACDHVMVVVNQGVFKQAKTQKILDKAIKDSKTFMILLETEPANGGAPIEHFLDESGGEIPDKYKQLTQMEWVPLYRSSEMLPASINTVLRQRGLAPRQEISGDLALFLSHQQAKAQGAVMVLSAILKQRGIKAWLDMDANDLSTQGMMDGVKNSDNFLLFYTVGYFERPYCLLELDEAIKQKKTIVLMYEERERFGGAALQELIDQVPSKYSFLCDNEAGGGEHTNMKHGWIKLEVRREFQEVMVGQLFKHCDIPPPNKEILSAFAKLPDHKALPQQLQPRFLQGTRQWMLDAVGYWHNNSNGSQVFGMLGQAGVGKSVFAAEVVARGSGDIAGGQSQGPSQFVGGYHFFKHDDERLTDVKNCIWMLSKQLRDNVPGFRKSFDASTMDANNVNQWTVQQCFTRLIVEPARQTPVPANGRVMLVFDALDECSDSHTIADLLTNQWKQQQVPTWLTVFFTSRPSVIAFPETDEDAVKQGVAVLNTENQSNLDDVKLYLRERVFKHHVADASQLEQFVDQVTAKSGGLFLYLRFLDEVIEKIMQQKQRRTLLPADLDNFPNGLGGVYNDYFGRLHEKLGQEDYNKLLAGVLGSREPLPKELWMRTAGVEGDLEDEDENEDLSEFFEREQLCANLLHIPTNVDHSGDNGVRFVHKSMVDYLTGGVRVNEETALKAKLKHLHIKPSTRRAALTDVCLEAFIDNGSQAATPAAVAYSARHSFFHLCDAKRFDEVNPLCLTLSSLLHRLGHDTPYNIDMDFVRYYDVKKNKNVQAKNDGLVVAKVMRLGFDALRVDRRQLAGQILGRLTKEDVADSDVLSKLRQQAYDYSPGVPWWRPVNQFLESATAGGALLRILTGHTAWVLSVAFSPDGNTIASGSIDKSIRLWDANTGQSKLGGKALEGHDGYVTSVAFSLDGNTIVSGSIDKSIRLWDANTGESKLGGKALEGHTASVESVAFSPDGNTIVSGSFDKSIRLWDPNTGESKLGGRALQGHTSLVYSVAFSPDGDTIVSGSFDRSIRLWDANTGELKLDGKVLEGHTDRVHSVAFSPDGNTIVSGSFDDTIRLWDANTGESKLGGKSLEGHTGDVISVAFSPDGNTIVSGSADKSIRLWDANTGESKFGGKALEGHIAKVTSVAFSPDGNTIVSGSEDKTIRLWDANTAEFKLGEKALEGHTKLVTRVEFSPDGNTVVTVSADKTIRLWDTSTGESKLGGKALEGQTNEGQTTSDALSVAFSPDGNTIVSGFAAHRRLQGRTYIFEFADKCIRLWDVNTGESKLGGKALEGHTEGVRSVAFSPDGSTIVSGSYDKSVRLWDANTGGPKLDGKALEGLDRVMSVAFSSDGKFVWGRDDEDAVLWWNAETGDQLESGDMVAEPQVGTLAVKRDGYVVHTPGSQGGGIGITCDLEPGAPYAFQSPSGHVKGCLSLVNNKLVFLELMQ